MSLFGVSSAFSQELDEATYSLQQRKYHLRHEFFIAPAFLPLDAFEKSVAGNVSYTFHINDGWAVEMAQVAYALNIDTGLKNDLRRLFGAAAVERDSLQYYGSINAVVKPIYRKLILFNRTIFHGETFFNLGAGPFKFKGQTGFRPAVNIGIGFRVFLNDWASIRFDARDYIWFDGANPNNVLVFALGLSMNMGTQ